MRHGHRSGFRNNARTKGPMPGKADSSRATNHPTGLHLRLVLAPLVACRGRNSMDTCRFDAPFHSSLSECSVCILMHCTEVHDSDNLSFIFSNGAAKSLCNGCAISKSCHSQRLFSIDSGWRARCRLSHWFGREMPACCFGKTGVGNSQFARLFSGLGFFRVCAALMVSLQVGS